MYNIEDIYFFEVNTKYISSSVLKTSEFSRVCSTSTNSDVFNSRDEIYLVFTEKKINFRFILYFFEDLRELLKMQKRKVLLNLNNFSTKISVMF